MKWFMMWVSLMGLNAFHEAHAAEQQQVVFLCDLENGSRVMLERDIVKDVFTLTYGKDLDLPEVTLRKLGNNMGTSLHLSSAESSLGREVYMTDGSLFYTVGYVDKGSSRTGYFHLTEETKEKTYSDCKPEHLTSLFGKDDLFTSLTEVD